MIANLQYGFEKSKGVQKLEGGWVSASLTSSQEEIFNKLWHLYANTRIDFAIMLITDKWS